MTVYSYSRLKCFEQCPQKYKFQYIEKIKTDTKETVELFLGKRVHEVLKRLHHDIMYNKENTLSDLIHFLHHQWEKKWDDSIVIVQKKRSWKEYLHTAEQYISTYYQNYKPFHQSRTIALEKRILVNLDKSGKYKLCGILDRVAKSNDGFYEIHDYKTNFHLPSVEEIQNNLQRVLYVLLLKQRYPYIKEVKLIWHFLRFNKEFCITMDDPELKKTKKDVLQLINKVESSERFSPKPSGLCHWCHFKSYCGV